jgi:hypothetical protein
MESEKRRTWADLVVLIVSVWTIGQAIWGPMLLPQRSQDQGAGSTYILAIVAGAAALFGVWLVQKQRGFGRALIAAAGAVILIGPFTYQRHAPLAMTFAIISGLLLLVSAKFVGPVPPPAGKATAAEPRDAT